MLYDAVGRVRVESLEAFSQRYFRLSVSAVLTRIHFLVLFSYYFRNLQDGVELESQVLGILPINLVVGVLG